MIVAILGCFVQIGIQGAALNANRGAKDNVDKILMSAGEKPQFAFIRGGILFTCKSIPKDGNPFDMPCYAFAGPGVSLPPNTTKRTDDNVLDVRGSKGSKDSTDVQSESVRKSSKDDDDDDDNVTISGFNTSNPDQKLSVSPRCLKALNWPAAV